MNFRWLAWLSTVAALTLAQLLASLLTPLIAAVGAAGLLFLNELSSRALVALALLALALSRLLAYVVALRRERSMNAAIEAGLGERGEAKARFWQEQHEQALRLGAQI